MAQLDRTDGLVGNAAIKYPCRMASTANLVLSGLQTVDGVVGAQDDRVLVKNQTTGTQNGIYVMDSGDWERAQDADNDGAFTEGSLIKVNNGTVGTGFWYITNTGTITIDSTAITFGQASGTLAFISAAWQAVVSLATVALGLTQAGFSAFVQTLLGAATALAFRQLLIVDKHGADIVAAATPNLDTATGDVVDITGNTGITGFTLTEGVEKVVRFTGTPTLTHGASLVLPGAANITAAAGDFAIFRGYAAGVVRCVAYVKASGAPVTMSPITASLGGDVALNNTANYFDGPTVAQGTVGKWLVSGTITLNDTAGAATFFAKLWDGTTVIATASVDTNALNTRRTVSLSGFISAPVANLRISARDASSTSGVIKFNDSGASKDSTITAIRIE